MLENPHDADNNNNDGESSSSDGSSSNSKRIHFDPCEAAIDEPLIYESWGKNQTYIISFPISNCNSNNGSGSSSSSSSSGGSSGGVLDVTSHYTSNFTASILRRLEKNETQEMVSNAINSINNKV